MLVDHISVVCCGLGRKLWFAIVVCSCGVDTLSNMGGAKMNSVLHRWWGITGSLHCNSTRLGICYCGRTKPCEVGSTIRFALDLHITVLCKLQQIIPAKVSILWPHHQCSIIPKAIEIY